jgi:hypothetical protein
MSWLESCSRMQVDRTEQGLSSCAVVEVYSLTHCRSECPWSTHQVNKGKPKCSTRHQTYNITHMQARHGQSANGGHRDL